MGIVEAANPLPHEEDNEDPEVPEIERLWRETWLTSGRLEPQRAPVLRYLAGSAKLVTITRIDVDYAAHYSGFHSDVGHI
jgi:hypothetical protein